MKSKTGFLLGCAMLLVAGASVARANECAEARQHLVIARRALQVHDYARAITEYQTSYEQDGNPSTLLFLARTEADIGEFSTAIDLYRSYLDQAPAEHRAFDVEGEIRRLSTIILERNIEIFDDRDRSAVPKVPVVD
jgi:tetratricopeptide (TPR) repeat protein